MIKDCSISSRFIDIFVYGFCLLIFVITLFPFLNIISTSLSGNKYVLQGEISFYPQETTIIAYKDIFTNNFIPNAFKNSIIYTVVSTAYSVLITVMMAYPLAKKKFVLKKTIWVMIVITMYFSGGIIPLFILVRKLGLYNTMWTQVFPCAIAIYNLILMRMFINTVPSELEESSLIDGANEAQILFKVILPLCKAGIATITLFYLVWKWNDFFNPYIYFVDIKKFPLTVVIRDIVIGNKVARFSEGTTASLMGERGFYAEAYQIRLKYAVIVVALAPIIVVYPILQKYFIKGMMIGSIKG